MLTREHLSSRGRNNSLLQRRTEHDLYTWLRLNETLRLKPQVCVFSHVQLGYVWLTCMTSCHTASTLHLAPSACRHTHPYDYLSTQHYSSHGLH
jgi:hypothetical protein